jgi:hypothetical protein
MNDEIATISTPVNPLRRISLYLPALAGPLAMCAAIIYCRILGSGPQASREMQNLVVLLEKIGPIILTLAVAVYWGKAIFTRNLSYVVIGTLVGMLLLRELHWRPESDADISIKDAIFPLLGICFLWMLLWRDIIDKPSENWRHTIFFVGGLACYALSQMVEKRLFKFIPDEQHIHSQMEELIECAGHTLLLVAAVLGSWRRRRIVVEDR